MLTKAAIIFACLYTVRARTFTINAYEDDTNEINNLSDGPVEMSVGNCINSECNTFCRRRGFARGVCISNNQCLCSARLMQDANLDDDITLANGEAVNTKAPESCDLRWCEQNCRRMGFPGGVCVNGRCKCDIRYSDNIPSTELSSENGEVVNTNAPESCDLRWCEQNCRRMGFPGGVCVNGRCKCDIRYSDNIPSTELSSANGEAVNTKAPESCDLRWCEQNCRRMGFPGGVCVNDRCKCDILYSDNIPSTELSSENGEVVNTKAPESCDLRWCEQNCRRMGFPGGVCVNGRCKCDILSQYNSGKDSLSCNVALEAESLTASVRSCINSQCNDLCRRLGFANGVCMSATECRCSGRLPRDASFNDAAPDNNEAADTPAPRSCDQRWCEQNCRRMGSRSGVCVNDRCKCDILYSDNLPSSELNSDKDNLSDEIAFDTSVRSCVNSECNDLCRRLGFARGVCISSTECRCSGHLPMDAILRNVGPESTKREDSEAAKGCDLRWCEQNCRRMGFPGGVCVNGRCKCDIRYSDNPSSTLFEFNPDIFDEVNEDVNADTESVFREESNDILQN
ncbi:unnamed protein product [Diatraea saccharalis]|uniref:Knottins-like domain-containing protein n=1 Tax=Diatraea saccharalis TaxID=40085 RepID=A0A9N9WHC1_9NEOP|nr:unnamed protein product [Diatraea saccharalis]